MDGSLVDERGGGRDQIVVIGSGPASIACTKALVDDGYRVTILDVGLELEAERKREVTTLLANSTWDDAALAPLKVGSDATVRSIPLKKKFGSDYPYREVLPHLGVDTQQVTTFASFARGGLSTVWGAAVLPYGADDIADWPITAAELAPYYRAVLGFMPLAATHDDLEERFPLHTDTAHPLQLSWQGAQLLRHLNKHRTHLRANGFTFGASRLALQAQPSADRSGCVYCGMCMYGCPHDAIYSSTFTLDRLISTGQVKYLKNVVVERIAEEGEQVCIYSHDRRDGTPHTYAASRVFLGSGVFPTAKILLKSLHQPDATLTLCDSQYFLLPLLSFTGTASTKNSDFHTLSQVFLEISDQGFSPYPVHLQIYTYNELYARALERLLGKTYVLFRSPANALLDRLMVLQGYLHSHLSGTVSVALNHDALSLRPNPDPRAAKTVHAVLRKLSRYAGRLGFVPLAPLLKLGNPGQGAHSGGTFPMRRQPGVLETDVYGRPAGWKRIHVIDASVLPSIPATTLTLTVMANAYRIGKEWRHGG